jgi:hypothetical protein
MEGAIMPNKTLYIRDEDIDAWERAEAASRKANQSLSHYITKLLRLHADEQVETEIRAGDRVTLLNGAPQKTGVVEGLYPMYAGWLSSGTGDVLFYVAWVSWGGEKTLERVDDLIKLASGSVTR